MNTTEHGPWSPTPNATGGIYYDSGNVGIGTNSPSAKLEVVGDISCNGLSSHVAIGASSVPFGNNSTLYVNGPTEISADDTGGIALTVTGGEWSSSVAMCIQYGKLECAGIETSDKIICDDNLTVNGNVGIGTSTPSAKLEVDGDIKATGDIISNVTSDIRFKTNINKIENPLEKISKINGYTYDWIQSDLHPYNGSDTGIIAQEVETMDLPGMVVTRSNGYKGVKYERLVPLLVESIKSLQETVTKQQEQINQLMKK